MSSSRGVPPPPTPNSIQQPPTIKGWLRRRSVHIGAWRKRYVVLTQEGLLIYGAETDAEPSKKIFMDSTVTIGDRDVMAVRGSTGMSHPNHSVFSISLPDGTKEFFAAETAFEAERWVEGITRMFARKPTTAPIPPPPSNTPPAVVAPSSTPPTRPTIRFASTYESTDNTEPGMGKTSKKEKQENLKKRLLRSASVGTFLPSGTGNSSLALINKALWQEVLISNGLRIFAEVGLTKEFPCLRISCVLPCTPERAFNMLNDLKFRTKWDGLVDTSEEAIKILNESDDGHFRKYHVKMRGQYVKGWWTAPRDYVLESSWRRDDDGSFVIIEQSSPDAARTPGYVRARIFAQGFTICPRRGKIHMNVAEYDPETEQDVDASGDVPSANLDNDCLLQVAIHADPGGWLSWASKEWGQEWLYALMLRVVGLREAIEFSKYRAVDFTTIQAVAAGTVTTGNGANKPSTSGKRRAKPVPPMPGAVGSSRGPAINATEQALVTNEPVAPPPTTTTTTTATTPRPTSTASSTSTAFEIADYQSTIPPQHWCNSDQPFKVRGPTYLKDKVKVESNDPMFDVVGVDLYKIPEGQEISAGELKGGVASRILAQPSHPFLFIVHFQVPGTPQLSFIIYFLARPGGIEGPSPFSELFSDFIEGDEQFRDTRFKLIPRVVKGGYIVKTTVGQTPAILGTKLVQSYKQGEQWFEVIVDVGSSSVAGGVLSVVKGYVKSLAMDLAFLLEPHTDNELPEAILGAIQFNSLDLAMAVPLPPQ